MVVVLLFSEVGVGTVLRREWVGSNYCLTGRGGGYAKSGFPQMYSLPYIRKIRKRIVLGLGLSTSVDP